MRGNFPPSEPLSPPAPPLRLLRPRIGFRLGLGLPLRLLPAELLLPASGLGLAKEVRRPVLDGVVKLVFRRRAEQLEARLAGFGSQLVPRRTGLALVGAGHVVDGVQQLLLVDLLVQPEFLHPVPE